jgi:hypothetical protein
MKSNKHRLPGLDGLNVIPLCERHLMIGDIAGWDPTVDVGKLLAMWPSGFVRVSEVINTERVNGLALHAWDRLHWIVRPEVIGEEAAWTIALKCAERAVESFAGSRNFLEKNLHDAMTKTCRLVRDWINADRGDKEIELARRGISYWTRQARGGGLSSRAVMMCWCGSWLLRLQEPDAAGNVVFLSRGTLTENCGEAAVVIEMESQLEIARQVLGVEKSGRLERVSESCV